MTEFCVIFQKDTPPQKIEKFETFLAGMISRISKLFRHVEVRRDTLTTYDELSQEKLPGISFCLTDSLKEQTDISDFVSMLSALARRVKAVDGIYNCTVEFDK